VESYMTKGPLDERIEIVSGKDFSAVIVKYGMCHTSKFIEFSFCGDRKYEIKVVEGITDKREKRKLLDEMTEIERLRAENNILKS
jgi:transposase